MLVSMCSLLVVVQDIVAVEVSANMPRERQILERPDNERPQIVPRKDFLPDNIKNSNEFLKRMINRLVNLAKVTPDAHSAVRMHEIARELDFVVELNCDAMETHKQALDEVDGYCYEEDFYIRNPMA